MKLTRFTTSRSLSDGQAMFTQRVEDCKAIYAKYKNQLVERACPCCGRKEFSIVGQFHGTFNIAQCSHCSTEFINAAPSEEALSEYYSEFPSNVQNVQMWEKRKNKNESSHIYDHRIIAIQNIVNSIQSEGSLNILEVGSGSGVFLDKLTQAFAGKPVEIQGIDLDKNAVEEAKKHGLNAIHGNIEQKYSELTEKYDLILHFELIEHLVDPIKFIQACKKILKPNGHILFTTPNGHGLDNRALGYNFNGRMMAHALFPPMHLNSFNTQNIYHMLMQQGFTSVQISTPGKLDVDMLNVHKAYDEIPESFKFITELDEETQANIQNLMSSLNCSGHMLVQAKNDG